MVQKTVLFILACAIAIGVQLTYSLPAEAADRWICTSGNQEVYVIEESVNWVNSYRCSVGVKHVNSNNNAAQNKGRSRKYFYENGAWYVSVMKSDPILVDTSYENQLILNYLLSIR